MHAIAEIYDQLNSTSDLQTFNLDAYVRKMTRSLLDTYTLPTDHISLSMELGRINLDVRRAVPVGLILNELIINALKYAYPGGMNGELKVELGKSDGFITLVVSDNGVGLSDTVRNGSARGMGMQLIDLLAKQIHGTLALETGHGTSVRVTFKE